MAIKKCQVCGAIISSGEICEKCEKETLKSGSSNVLDALKILGRI